MTKALRFASLKTKHMTVARLTRNLTKVVITHKSYKIIKKMKRLKSNWPKKGGRASLMKI